MYVYIYIYICSLSNIYLSLTYVLTYSLSLTAAINISNDNVKENLSFKMVDASVVGRSTGFLSQFSEITVCYLSFNLNRK